MPESLVEVESLSKYYPIETSFLGKKTASIKAVDSIDLNIYAGESLGLVGETGCGKSTLGRSILQLIRPTSGTVKFNFGTPLEFGPNMKRGKFRENSKHLRRLAQIVFQDPFSSMNPRMLIKDIVAEPLQTHHLMGRGELIPKVSELLESVGLQKSYMFRYPHELSGGQLQRAAIARAIAVSPKFIVLDEPTSSLDASVQIQVLRLLKTIQSNYRFTYLFISHNLGVIDYMCDRVAVMYLGKIIEIGSKSQVFNDPLHPYTKSLLAAVPSSRHVPNIDPSLIASGDLPSPANPPKGCPYHPRCPLAYEKCGWEPRDLLLKYQTEIGTGVKSQISGNLLILESKIEQPEMLVSRLREMSKVHENDPLFRAMVSMVTKNNQVIIEFQDPKFPMMTLVSGGTTSVSCFLYTTEGNEEPKEEHVHVK